MPLKDKTSLYPDELQEMQIPRREELKNTSSYSLLRIATQYFNDLRERGPEPKKTFLWDPLVRLVLGYVTSARRLFEYGDKWLALNKELSTKQGEGLEELIMAGLSFSVLIHRAGELKNGKEYEERAREKLRQVSAAIYEPGCDWGEWWSSGKAVAVKSTSSIYSYAFCRVGGLPDLVRTFEESEVANVIKENQAFIKQYEQHVVKGPAGL